MDPRPAPRLPFAPDDLAPWAFAPPARRPRPVRHARESAAEARTMAWLRAVGTDLAARFDLRDYTLEAERPGVIAHYGICFADGRIRIRLRHARTRRLLKASSLVDTLCHELAHLRHLDHSPRFRRFYARILRAARALGHYRPGPDPGAPRQLALFPGAAVEARRR